MEKYLVTIEFRYSDISEERTRRGRRLDHISKTVTIGVFATVDGFLETATYYGYSIREAKRKFRERFIKPKKP